MKKSYQVLKWTAEVREKELQCLEEVELLDNHDPAVEFESDSESEAYDFLEKEKGRLYKSLRKLYAAAYNLRCN